MASPHGVVLDIQLNHSAEAVTHLFKKNFALIFAAKPAFLFPFAVFFFIPAPFKVVIVAADDVATHVHLIA